MDMEATPHIYEAFVRAGFEPANANMVERAIRADTDQRQGTIEKQILDRVMTKEDSLVLEQRLVQKFGQSLDKLEQKLEQRLEKSELKFEQRLEKSELQFAQSLEKLEQRLERSEQKLDLKLDSLRSTINSQTWWFAAFLLSGLTVATAIIAMVVSRLQ